MNAIVRDISDVLTPKTMKQHQNPGWLRGVLDSAVKAFNESDDKKLLCDEPSDDGEQHGSVGERAIAHRLAVHIERVLQTMGYPNETVPIATDCEYNRHRGAVKQLFIKAELRKIVDLANRKVRKDPKRESRYFFSVFPDIIVHERGEDRNNLIVIEIKRASNTVGGDYDKLKLELFTRPDYDDGYGYRLGASVIAMDQEEPKNRKLFVSACFIKGKMK